MSVVVLAASVAASAGDKTAVDVGGLTPFLPGRQVEYEIDLSAATGTDAVIAIDGSDDNSSWVADLATYTGLHKARGMIPCYRYMRASVTTAAGTAAGTVFVALSAEN